MVKYLLSPFAALLLLFATSISSAADTWTEINLTLTDRHITPRYEALASAGEVLAQQLHLLCDDPNTLTLSGVREGFHQVMDAWQGIQHIRFGPVELFLRYNRHQLWPDKHNTGEKQLRKLLAAADTEILKPENFRQASVAVQGLSALERLLFAENATPEHFGASGRIDYRCHLADAIAVNLAEMGRGIVNDWRSEYHNEILTAEAGNDYFEASEEVSSKLLNNLHTQLQAIVDQKLLRPMEESAVEAKPRRAESWRSRRSLRNIALNLEATREMYQVGFAPLLSDNPPLAKQLEAAFDATITLAKSGDRSLYESVAVSEQRAGLERLLKAARNLKNLVGTELPLAMNLPLGFNSLDGD